MNPSRTVRGGRLEAAAALLVGAAAWSGCITPPHSPVADSAVDAGFDASLDAPSTDERVTPADDVVTPQGDTVTPGDGDGGGGDGGGPGPVTPRLAG